MNRAAALAEIEASFARPSSTPSGWRDDRSVYIEEQKAELRRLLIDPFLVSAVAGEWAQEYAGHSNAVRSLYAVAHRGESWLLFEPTAKEFALAKGRDPATQPLELIGFSSEDALAEWLG